MIGIFYGTRPEYIKLLPLIDELDHRAHPFKLIQVGQHDSLIEGCDYDYKIDIKEFTENRLNDIIVSVLQTVRLLLPLVIAIADSMAIVIDPVADT